MHQSVQTIDAPEFINLQPLDINPLMSACEIKVFYLGDNRNRSSINRETALKMAKTLRGAPIVGYFKEDKGDFFDHGEKVTIDGDGVHFSCDTRPYGFVAPNAEVWFQTFDEIDENGNPIRRTYMMTTGFIWTGQYPESKVIFESEDGRPHSMELDEESMEGEWKFNSQKQMDFFIINDSVFSKLCVLGEEVEPCYEGSSVKRTSFTMDDSFKNTLFTMMQDLKFALKGEQQMDNEKITLDEQEEAVVVTEEQPVQEVASEFAASEDKKKDEDKKEEEAKEDSSEKEDASDDEEDDEKKKKFAKSDDEEKEEEKKDDKPASKSALEVENESLQAQVVSLTAERDDLQTKYTALEASVAELQAFKTEVENEQKKTLIGTFYMLEDEDKAEYLNNLSKYTYDEIKSALSVVCFDKKVSFAAEEVAEPAPYTYTLEEPEDDLPEWFKIAKALQDEL